MSRDATATMETRIDDAVAVVMVMRVSPVLLLLLASAESACAR